MADDMFDEYFDSISQKEAADAGAVLSSVQETPDQAANSRVVAKHLGVRPFVVSMDPNFYSGLLAQKRATTALSSAPKTSKWLKNPENAALAKDDVETIGAFEAIGNSMARFGYGWLQSFNQQGASSAYQISKDSDRSFSEIFEASKQRIMSADGKTVEREQIGLGTLQSATTRWAVSRIASMFGVESDRAAEDFQITAGYYANRAGDAPMTAGAAAVSKKVKD